MFTLGLKLWSTNENYIGDAVKLFQENRYRYIELYSVPGSYGASAGIWKPLTMPFVIHAPHYTAGMNLSLRECEKKNGILLDESRRFADALNAQKIIVHPGVDGTIEETARQISRIGDSRIVIENKPFWGLQNERCVGYSTEEIGHVVKETGCGFCLDISHAVCAANALNLDPVEYLSRFCAMKPDMYHVSDGDFAGLYDTHEHLGAGSFPLAAIFQLLPDGAMITVETKKEHAVNLDDFARDIGFINSMCIV